MTDESAKKAFWALSIVSVVIGAILSLMTYGDLLDVRSMNLTGLVWILVIGVYLIFVTISARKAKSQQ